MATRTPVAQEEGQVDVNDLSESFSGLRVRGGQESGTPRSALRTRRRQGATRRVLFSSQEILTDTASNRSSFPSWSQQEELALIRFLLLYTDGTSWSSRSGKGDRFWEKAGIYIQREISSSYCRTGLSKTS